MEAFNLPSLENRQIYLKLCYLYKILHGQCYFPESIVYTQVKFSSLLQTSYTPSTPTTSTSPLFWMPSENGITFHAEIAVCAPTYINFKNSLSYLPIVHPCTNLCLCTLLNFIHSLLLPRFARQLFARALASF